MGNKNIKPIESTSFNVRMYQYDLCENRFKHPNAAKFVIERLFEQGCEASHVSIGVHDCEISFGDDGGVVVYAQEVMNFLRL